MTNEQQTIERLKKVIEDNRISHFHLQEEFKRIKQELNKLKVLAKGNPMNWYTLYLQGELSTIERQYTQLQEDYHELNAKHNKEMEKRQYIFAKEVQ